MPGGIPGGVQTINYGSSMTIEELTPAGPNFQLRQLILLGPALPFMGAEWAFENNLQTTWYPGNGVEGTQQVLGPRELPSNWEGAWNRTLMGTSPSIFIDETGTSSEIRNPHVMREIFEDIARAGSRLRVTWAVIGTTVSGRNRGVGNEALTGKGTGGTLHNVDVRILREGRIKTFRTPIDRHTDIRWSAEFHWVSRGGTSDKAVSTRDDQNLSDAANSLIASTAQTAFRVDEKIKSIKKNIRKSASNISLGQLEQLAGAPTAIVTSYTRQLQQNVSTFKRIGDIAQKLRTQPFSIANATVDFARNTTAIANTFVDQMGRKPPEQLALKSKVSSLLRSANYFWKVSDTAMLNARRGEDLNALLRSVLVSGGNRGTLTVKDSATTRAGDILAIHICKSGDTAQNVSQRFYGGPDHGPDILRANRLPLYTPFFRPGLILIIPTLSNTPRNS